jgi:hypothetical protein
MKATELPTALQLFRLCVAEIRLCVLQTAVALCVLQTAVAALQSADCDTEWLICINVVTGGVLCRKGIIRV